MVLCWAEMMAEMTGKKKVVLMDKMMAAWKASQMAVL